MVSLLWLVVLLVIVGVVMYWIPMDARMKQIIYVLIAVVLLLLLAFTLLGPPPAGMRLR